MQAKDCMVLYPDIIIFKKEHMVRNIWALRHFSWTTAMYFLSRKAYTTVMQCYLLHNGQSQAKQSILFLSLVYPEVQMRETDIGSTVHFLL